MAVGKQTTTAVATCYLVWKGLVLMHDASSLAVWLNASPSKSFLEFLCCFCGADFLVLGGFLPTFPELCEVRQKNNSVFFGASFLFSPTKQESCFT